MINKKELRRKFLSLRNSMPREEIKDKSILISDNFFNTEYYINAKSIFIYLNINSEVRTDIIINRAWNDNKKIAVPVLTEKPHEMLFAEIHNFQCLKKNKLGILEPDIKSSDIIKSDINTVIVVPGLVYSNDKNRIGYGGGYYDKYLSENQYMKSVGIAFDFQVLEEIPTEGNDIILDSVISEKCIY